MITGIDDPTHVVDANIVLGWSLDRPFSVQAAKFRSKEFHLAAPDLIVHEVGSALSYYVKSGVLQLRQAEDAYSSVTAFVELVSGIRLRFDSLRLSVTHGHPIYDCFYLALASRLEKPLVTADRKLAALCKRCGVEAIILN